MTNKKEPYVILIVDDEEINFFLLKTLLKEVIGLKCEIFHSTNGKNAVDMCNTNSDIDIVFMDIRMPIMDGHEATKKIKELRPKLPVVVQTAFSTTEEREKSNSAGCDDFISKPIGQETLIGIINKYLKGE